MIIKLIKGTDVVTFWAFYRQAVSRQDVRAFRNGCLNEAPGAASN